MTDLPAFRQAVRQKLRSAGRTQQQLAREMGLHPDALSHKINGRDGSLLTARDAVALMATLAAWGAIGTQGEADELVRLGAVPGRLVSTQPWYVALRTPPSDVVPRTPRDWSELGDPLRPVPLPSPLTPFIGRSAVIATVCAAVREVRLVTLTGIGGTGKTRVALEVAAAVAPQFPHGVAFVDLAPISDPALLAGALAAALGLHESTGDPERWLAEALRAAELLLLVDNMEHLVAGGALLGRLLTGARGVRALVTSRVPLRLYGEHEFRVPPMTLPSDTAATPAGIRDSEAVQLFLARARAISPGLDPHGEALGAAAEICTALEGIPLAIELAAAQTRLWSPQGIRSRLGERLGFLVDRARDRPDRHRSLQATLEWSEALLGKDARHLLAQLGVFAGSFDARAAAAVAGHREDAVLDLLAELAEHGLIGLTEVATPDWGARFRMLESVRAYAVFRLVESGEYDKTRRAHLRYYVDLAGGMDARGLGPVAPTSLDRLEVERADVNAALGWVCSRAVVDAESLTDGLRLAAALTRVWNRRWTVREGRTYLNRLLDVAAVSGGVAVDIRATADIRAAMLSASSGDFDQASRLATEALRLFIELGDLSGMSWARCQLGEAALSRDDLFVAYEHFTAQLGLARRAHDQAAEADAYNMLGQTSGRLGRYEDAEAQLTRSVGTYRRLGILDGVGSALDSAADIAFRRWDIALAAARWADALRVHRQTGNRKGTAYHLEGCAKVLAANDRPAAALQQVSAAQRLRAAAGWVLPQPEQAFLDSVLAPVMSALTPAEREEAVAAGRNRDLAEVIENALAQLDAMAAPPV